MHAQKYRNTPVKYGYDTKSDHSLGSFGLVFFSFGVLSPLDNSIFLSWLVLIEWFLSFVLSSFVFNISKHEVLELAVFAIQDFQQTRSSLGNCLLVRGVRKPDVYFVELRP